MKTLQVGNFPIPSTNTPIVYCVCIDHAKFICFKLHLHSLSPPTPHPEAVVYRVDRKVFTCHPHLDSSSTCLWTFRYYGLFVYVSLFFSPFSISHGWLTQNVSMNIKTTPINMSLYILSTQFSTGGTRCWVGRTVVLHSHCSSMSPALKAFNNFSILGFSFHYFSIYSVVSRRDALVHNGYCNVTDF